MKRILFCLMAVLVVFVLATPAHAFLITRGTDTLGNRLIYDDDRDITWYDFSNAPNSWANQVAWVLGLSVTFDSTTYDDWRLPTALNFEEPFSSPDLGFDVTGSEMGHLYYTELGNVAFGGLTNTGDFQNLISSVYWSGTEFAPNSPSAWIFNFDIGHQDTADKNFSRYGLAVRSGDVAAATSVPEPTTIALLGIGLAGMAVYGVRRRRQHR